jgi:hypothetical protein
MNIQNIVALAEQLQLLGFENIGYSLAKRICFKPGSFLLIRQTENRGDSVSFQLYFEKNKEQNEYFLLYYDAIFQKKICFDQVTINGINVVTLEKQMAEIDWKKAFEFDEKKLLSADDKTGLEKEQRIEAIINDLISLEKTDKGKSVAASLKLNHWSGTSYQELFGNITIPKNKAEVSQRFYFLEGQNGISVDEAYRFLQNRWLEKEMQAKKKQMDTLNVDGETTNHETAGNGLLRKKRSRKSRAAKKD